MTRSVKIGNITIGGGNRIAIQSMTNTDTADRESTLLQLKRLQDAGCRKRRGRCKCLSILYRQRVDASCGGHTI